MSIIDAIIMGIIQGLTEFLPVSSSGHLAIFSAILPSLQQNDMLLNVLLHFGTLVAVCAAFYKEVIAVVLEFFRAVGDIFTGKFSFKNMSGERRMLIMIIVATLPLFAVLPIKDAISSLGNSLIAVGIALLVTSLLLFVSDRIVTGTKGRENISYSNALVVGITQAVATIPGISRSGSTITAGLACGFSRELAFSFAFVMSIPAVFGANVLELYDVIKGDAVLAAPVYVYIAGVVAAMVTGYLSIFLLKWILKKEKFTVFSIYCAIAGIAAIALDIFN